MRILFLLVAYYYIEELFVLVYNLVLGEVDPICSSGILDLLVAFLYYIDWEAPRGMCRKLVTEIWDSGSY